MNIVSYIVLGVFIVVAVIIVFIYNTLIRRRNQVEEAWSDIEVQLKRRYDLIPNVVETVRGYMIHEREVLENVTKARTQAVGANTLEEHAKAENMLTNTLKTLFAVSENYPDLKANANFLDLQRELADTENKIQAARRFYNGNVRDYNITIETVPQNFVAKFFMFEKKEFFELEQEEAREPVKVSFNKQ